jgi:predicted enzyme related to lactoylglutathione lyase
MAHPNFIELPARDMAATKRFYEQAFGWNMADFGPTYACTTTGDVDVGLQADPKDAPKAPLVVTAVDDLEAALKSVIQAGGKISKPIFSFPGVRRFHFIDPSGNELAVWQTAE